MAAVKPAATEVKEVTTEVTKVTELPSTTRKVGHTGNTMSTPMVMIIFIMKVKVMGKVIMRVMVITKVRVIRITLIPWLVMVLQVPMKLPRCTSKKPKCLMPVDNTRSTTETTAHSVDTAEATPTPPQLDMPMPPQLETTKLYLHRQAVKATLCITTTVWITAGI